MTFQLQEQERAAKFSAETLPHALVTATNEWCSPLKTPCRSLSGEIKTPHVHELQQF